MVLARRVDGLIFGDAHSDGRLLDELAERGTRFVLVNCRAGDHPAVTPDDRLGGRLAAEHLLGLGHEHVAVIAGEPYASTGRDRTAGFVERYREAGVEVPPELVVPSRFDAAGGREAARTIFATARPTAIFAVNDFAAVGAAGVARDHGLRMGRDISIIGYNDAPLMADLPIPLTTIRVPLHELGRRSVDLLARLLAGEAVASEHVTPELVVRASTVPPRPP